MSLWNPATLVKHPLPDDGWPDCWKYYPRATVEGNVRYDLGAMMRVEKNGDLFYKCVCGATMRREPGFKNEEARAWVGTHRRHVSAP